MYLFISVCQKGHERELHVNFEIQGEVKMEDTFHYPVITPDLPQH